MKLWHLIAGIALVVFLLVLLAVRGIDLEYSSGSRAGTVTKFSKKGYAFKTYEGELLMGGVRSNVEGNLTSNIFEFSVVDPAMAEEVDKALTSGKRVKLHYRQVWMGGFTKGNTDYFITKVELVDPSVPVGKEAPQ